MSKYNRNNLKVGQKVVLVKDDIANELKSAYTVVPQMEKHLGKEVTINGLYDAYFMIEESEERWAWNYRLIDRVVTEKKEKPQAKVYKGDRFLEYEYYILPNSYSLKKVIECGKAVICFVEEDYTRKVIKTVAKCSEEDTFNLHKGVEICMYKTLRKIADKNLKRF